MGRDYGWRRPRWRGRCRRWRRSPRRSPPCLGCAGDSRGRGPMTASRSLSTMARTRKGRRPCSKSSPATTPGRRSFASASRRSAIRRCAARSLRPGHAIALHGQRHRCQLRLTPRQVADDLDRGAETLGADQRQRAGDLPAAVRDLQPGGPARHSPTRAADAALVALGSRLAPLRHARRDRRRGDGEPASRGRDPPSRRRPLQRRRLVAANGRGAAGDLCADRRARIALGGDLLY